MKSDAICCPVFSYATTTSALISVCARLVPGVRSPTAVPVAAARNARRSIDIEFRSMALLPKSQCADENFEEGDPCVGPLWLFFRGGARKIFFRQHRPHSVILRCRFTIRDRLRRP